LAIVSQQRAAFTDPGIIKNGFEPPYIPEDYEVKHCERCEEGK